MVDRDGIVNELVLDGETGTRESLYKAAAVAVAPGAADGLRSLRDAGFRLVVVSNQPASAKRRATVKGLSKKLR